MMTKQLRTPYTELSLQELRQWIGKKMLRLDKIDHYNSWFAKQEKRRLWRQINDLQIELDSRYHTLPDQE